MTTNQIAYWTLRESARHNVVQEQETIRHNRETEGQGWLSLNLTQQQLDEQKRHNAVTEDQSQQSINETVYHNRIQEQIGFGQIRATVAAASIGAAASMYGADQAAAASRYGSDQSRAASEYNTNARAFNDLAHIGIDQQNADTNALNAQNAKINAYSQAVNSGVNVYSAITGNVNKKAEMAMSGVALFK